jgi:hypothetical protein
LDGWDRASWDVPSVASHGQNAHRRGFYPITRTMADLWSRIAQRDRDNARSLISGWELSPYLLVRRIRLFAMRDQPTFDANEVWATLKNLDDETFWGGEAQVEIARLVTGRWQELGAVEREEFEAPVQDGPPAVCIQRWLSRTRRTGSRSLILSSLNALRVCKRPGGR